VIYTGHGGNDPETGKQVADQVWKVGNAGLALNCIEGRPVRLIRGANVGSPYAPKEGYRYDGLYFVAQYWEATGKSGFRICQFRLLRDDSSPQPWLAISDFPWLQFPKRQSSTVQRIVRNTAMATSVKSLYKYTCQVCGIRLETPAGPYAEGAHIQALGEPHNGPDVEENILCLCPNHHVLFDSGALKINDDFTLDGYSGTLTTHPQHKISLNYLAYHRKHSAHVRD
jgi:putative restriction endonuclease